MRRTLPLLAVLLIYVAHRLLVLAGATPLLFDLNDAEYGFFRAIAGYLDTPLQRVFTEPRLRHAFLHDCLTVGNQVHGTLGLSGSALLIAVKGLGAPLSTWTLKLMALLGSTAGVALWMGTLWRAHGRRRGAIAFALLATVGPVIWVKLSLLYWGTHEVVALLVAVLYATVGSWVGRPESALPGGPAAAALVRVAVAGAAAALLGLCNYSLLMPAGFLVGWLVLEALLCQGAQAQQGARRWLTLALLLLVLPVVAGGAAWLTANAVLSTGWLEGLGLPRRLNTNHFLLLAGKRGDAFLHPGADAPASMWNLALWQGEAWSKALPLVPGRRYGANAASVEGYVRAATALIALWHLGVWGVRQARCLFAGADAPSRARALAAALGAYLLVAWVLTTVMCLSYGLGRDGIMGIQPRYYAHLYPVAFAVWACWLAGEEGAPRWLAWPRWGALAALLFLGSFDNRALIDTKNLDAWTRYEGVPAYVQAEDDPHFSRAVSGRLPQANRSAAWIRGYRIVQRYQTHEYWGFSFPSEMGRADHVSTMRAHADKAGSDAKEPDFWEGMGAGLRTLVPPARDARLSWSFEQMGAHSASLAIGYAGSPEVSP